MGFSYSSKLGDGTGIGDDWFSYNPVTDTLDVGTLTANNVVVTALATPTITSVTPTLTQVGTINVVAGASLADGDYFTVDYGSGTILIEFDLSPGNGTTGGRVPYVYAAGDTADQIRDGLITLLNSAAGTALTASSGGAATVSLSLDTPGAPGDMNTENVANAGFTVAGFADPTAATTYGYKAVSYLADGTSTAASAEVTTAAGHATLSASNYNTVVFAPSAGSTSTRLYRVRDGTGVLATPRLLYTGTATSYVDTGAAGTAETPATGNTTGRVTADRVAAVTVATTGNVEATGSVYGLNLYSTSGLRLTGASEITWGPVGNYAAYELFLTRAAAATLQLGAATSTSAPVAQTITVQGRTGTDVAGADWTHIGSLGAGSAASGKQIFRVGTPQAAGTTRHVAATALTLQDTGIGGTAAPQALFADGTAAKPSVAFASNPNTGLYSNSSNVIGFAAAGGVVATLSSFPQFAVNADGGRFALGASADLILSRPAAATLQLGAANAASPVAQTLQAQGSRGGTDTDVAGANLTIRPGAGTGAGAASSIMFQTPAATVSGNTAQSYGTRLTVAGGGIVFGSAPIPLTDGGVVNGTAGLRWSNVHAREVTTYPGTGTASARASGVLHVSTTAQATTGTSEEVLATYTMPANTLARDGQAVRITAWLSHAANTNGTTSRIRFGGIGGTIVASLYTAVNADVMRLEAIVARTGAATQTSIATNFANGGGQGITVASPTQTLSNAVDVVVSATTSVAAGDVTVLGMIVEALN